MASKHFKCIYKSEIPPKVILSKMLNANMDDNYFDNSLENRIDLNIERNRTYFSRRRELKNLMKLINSHLENNSQTLFLALYYMDLIFTHKDLEKIFFSHFYTYNVYESFNDIQMSNYVLLSLACLIVASKFNENDPHVPTISSYIRLLYEYSKKEYIFNLPTLYMAEVVVIKLLEYKLNYYTIYHYLLFFFTHGIIFKKTIEKSNIFKKYSERKILEKIYIQTREIIDEIIDSEKYFNLYFGKNNYIIVIEILLWSIEHTINLKINDNENIFKLVFDLNIEENNHKEIYTIIEEIYKYIKKRNNFGNKSTKIYPSSNTSFKAINLKTKESESSNLYSKRQQNSEFNFKNIQPKSSLPNSKTLLYKKTYYERPPAPPKPIIKIAKTNVNNFNTDNKIINNKMENYNSTYKLSKRHHIPQNSVIIKNDSWVPQSIINMPNNRVYLTSIKNINSNYQLNLEDKDNEQKINNLINDIDMNNLKKKQEPTDNPKNLITDYQIRNNKSINNNEEKVPMNNVLKINRKKSFSCTKNKNYDYNIFYNLPRRQSISGINDKIQSQLIFDESNSKTKNFDNSKESNNYYYTINKTGEYVEENKIDEKDNLYEQRQPSNNNKHYLKRSNNIFSYNDKIISNYNNRDELVDKNKVIFHSTKLSQNSKLEPQDNDRRSYKKKNLNERMIYKINKSYNKSNTIIINNNIHINTFIDKNKLNLNKKDLIKRSANKILYNPIGKKKINEIVKDKIKKKLRIIRVKDKRETNFNHTNKINKEK